MLSFKEIAISYSVQLEEAKLKKRKVWKMIGGNLKKVLKKECHDSDGKTSGWKVEGKKCIKMSPAEIKQKEKSSKKMVRTKGKREGKIARNLEKINKKKISKGLIQKPKEEETIK